MVLPETWTAALVLLIASACCFSLWPNLFKLAGMQWRFELFSLDFAVGSLLVALVAAYTLGSRGSELDFSDSMLVAGRRAELMAVGSGVVFAFGNMLYLGTIALMGLSNATLLTFSVFGCAVGGLQLSRTHSLPSLTAAILILAMATLLAALAAKSAREASAARAAIKPISGLRAPQEGNPRAMTLSTKGSITGILAGLAFAGVWPVLAMAQTDELGIGAYGGSLMAAIGVVVATVFLNFFFMNISLEGGQVGFSDYLAGSIRNHAIGLMCGAVWAAGALALYTASTGGAIVTKFDAWCVPFAGALIAVVTGIIFWQKIKLSAEAKRNKFLATALFIAGIAALLNGLRT